MKKKVENKRTIVFLHFGRILRISEPNTEEQKELNTLDLLIFGQSNKIKARIVCIVNCLPYLR